MLDAGVDEHMFYFSGDALDWKHHVLVENERDTSELRM